MNYKETDKIIADKYLSLDPDFDSESAWNQLEPKIKRKRRSGLWFWFFASFIVLALVSFYQLSTIEEVKDIKLSDAHIADNESTAGESGIKSNNDNKIENLIQNESIESHTNSLLQKYRSLQLNNFSNDDSVNKSIAKSTSVELQTNTVIPGYRYLDNEVVDTPVDNDIVINDNRERQASILHDENVLDTETRKSISIENITAGFTKLEFDREMEMYTGDLPAYSRRNSSRESNFRFGVFGGYFIHSRSLEYSGVGSNETYNSRVDEEDAIDAFDLGLKLDYFVNDNLVVFSGLRYDLSYVERNADYTYLKEVTLPDQTILIVETDEGTIEKKGSVTYDGYYQHTSNNYLTTKRLGVLAGLQYRVGSGRWNTHLNLGVEVPIWTKTSGIITNNGIPYNLSDGDFEISNPQPLMFGGVGTEYSLTNGIGLQLLILGYMPVGNEYKEAYKIIKKSTVLGVNLGLHFQL